MILNIMSLIILGINAQLLSMDDAKLPAKEQQSRHMAILVSGNGSNMEAILAKKIPGIKPCVVISNNSNAPALDRAKKYNVPTAYIGNKPIHTHTQRLTNCLAQYAVTPENGLLCLAGYMKILDKDFVNHFKNNIINIHPSLLPAFPGLHAIEQALNAGVEKTGCTVHVVDAGVDTGPIIMQQSIPITNDDTYKTLEQKIHEAEHILYPKVVALFAQNRVVIEGRTVHLIPSLE